MRKATKKTARRAFRVLPHVKTIVDAARISEEKRFWYQRATERIKARYDEDTDIFIGLLAATSPRHTVAKNLRMAISIFSAWELNDKAIDDETLDELGKLGHIPARYWNIQRALKRLDLLGPKVNAFQRNLLGDLTDVTIDTWMITFAGTQYIKELSCLGGIEAYKHRVRRAARVLNWEPAEVQAAVWAYCYSVTEGTSINAVPEFDFKDEFDNADVIC